MKVKNSEVIFSGLILGAAMHIYCVAKTFYTAKKESENEIMEKSHIRKLIYCIRTVVDNINVSSFDEFSDELRMTFNIKANIISNNVVEYIMLDEKRVYTSNDILNHSPEDGHCYNTTDLYTIFDKNYRTEMKLTKIIKDHSEKGMV